MFSAFMMLADKAKMHIYQSFNTGVHVNYLV